MKFFTMWYDRQTPEMREQVKVLVKEGRLEFANGGWSATDEACPNYEDMINNMIIGHSFLMKEFGVKPRVGWHLDAFGHSATNARLFSDFGFEAMFLGRVDKTDKIALEKAKAFSFIWRPHSTHFGASKQILTYNFKDKYCWVPGFWVDDDDSLETDPTLESFNANK
jgi:lysosomal alpha-mannosidase